MVTSWQTSVDPIEALITTYSELNADSVDELNSDPSPLEFMRYVARNAPFVVRGGASQWEACRKWDVAYLKEKMKGQKVNVAVTPFGGYGDLVKLQEPILMIKHRNADAPLQHYSRDGSRSLLFVKPWEEDQDFDIFLNYVKRKRNASHQSTMKTSESQEEVRYAQTQNDNLREEYATLFSDVEQSVPWARIALDKEPDAINLWIGNERSVTALHKDNYENIYVQVVGEKHFVLLPPVAHACVGEEILNPASYVRKEGEGGEIGNLVVVEEAGDAVPFATWDPDNPSERATPYSKLASPLRVSLRPGDMMYLPACWYHKVSQSCSPEGICCSVNYWYDMEYTGSFFSTCGFIRNVTAAMERTRTDTID